MIVPLSTNRLKIVFGPMQGSVTVSTPVSFDYLIGENFSDYDLASEGSQGKNLSENFVLENFGPPNKFS